MLTVFCDFESQHNFQALPQRAAQQQLPCCWKLSSHHGKGSVLGTAHKQGCNKWWQRFQPPFTSDLHPLRKRESIFVQISQARSDNAALFSNSHKLGIHHIHQPGLLPSNGHSQLLNGLGRGWDCSVSKRGKVQGKDTNPSGKRVWS